MKIITTFILYLGVDSSFRVSHYINFKIVVFILDPSTQTLRITVDIEIPLNLYHDSV